MRRIAEPTIVFFTRLSAVNIMNLIFFIPFYIISGFPLILFKGIVWRIRIIDFVWFCLLVIAIGFLVNLFRAAFWLKDFILYIWRTQTPRVNSEPINLYSWYCSHNPDEYYSTYNAKIPAARWFVISIAAYLFSKSNTLARILDINGFQTLSSQITSSPLGQSLMVPFDYSSEVVLGTMQLFFGGGPHDKNFLLFVVVLPGLPLAIGVRNLLYIFERRVYLYLDDGIIFDRKTVPGLTIFVFKPYTVSKSLKLVFLLSLQLVLTLITFVLYIPPNN